MTPTTDTHLRQRLNEYFEIEAQRLLADVRSSATLTTHSSTQGTAGEEAARDFLRRHLPKRYGVGAGHVVSFLENSAQADVVIYDQLDCFAIPITTTASLYSVEGVYAAMEIKASPSRRPESVMKKALKNIASIKTLQGAFQIYTLQSDMLLYTRPFDLDIQRQRCQYVLPSLPVGAILILGCGTRFETVARHYRKELSQIQHWHDECDLLCVLDEENFGLYGSDITVIDKDVARKYWREPCTSAGEALALLLYWLVHKMYVERHVEFPIVHHKDESQEEEWSIWPTALAPAIRRIRVDAGNPVMSWPWLQKTREFEE